MSWIQTHLVPNMLNGVYDWTPSWPVHDLHILLCQKSRRVTCSVECGIVLDIHNVSSKKARHPLKEAYYRGETWCSAAGLGFHSAPQVHSSHHGGWHPILWLRGHGYRPWVGCSHYQSLFLLVALTSMAITVKQREATPYWRHSASSAWDPTHQTGSIPVTFSEGYNQVRS